MATLLELAEKYGTDKREHEGYFFDYSRYLDPLRDEDILIFEIGIQGGKSLRMWREFFPKGMVHAIDNNAGCCINDDRIRSFAGSQEDVVFLEKMMGLGIPDVLVDDGGHIASSIITSFEFIFPKMKPGSLYIVEDLHVHMFARFLGTSTISALAYFQAIQDDPEKMKERGISTIEVLRENMCVMRRA